MTYPEIHHHLLSLGFQVRSDETWPVVPHEPGGRHRYVYYRLEGKSWTLRWSMTCDGTQTWKAEYMTPWMDCYFYWTAADAIDRSDRHRAYPVEQWRKELATRIRAVESPENGQGALL
jgi:hypothetical protein